MRGRARGNPESRRRSLIRSRKTRARSPAKRIRSHRLLQPRFRQTRIPRDRSLRRTNRRQASLRLRDLHELLASAAAGRRSQAFVRLAFCDCDRHLPAARVLPVSRTVARSSRSAVGGRGQGGARRDAAGGDSTLPRGAGSLRAKTATKALETREFVPKMRKTPPGDFSRLDGVPHSARRARNRAAPRRVLPYSAAGLRRSESGARPAPLVRTRQSPLLYASPTRWATVSASSFCMM